MAFNLKKSILYEDAHMFVVNKPSGLMVHGDGRSKAKTLADYILKAYPAIKDVGEPAKVASEKLKVESQTDEDLNLPPTTYHLQPILRPGIVHRLDAETSGVLLVAKDQPTFLYLKRQFKEHTIKKTYHAVVWGNMKDDSGTIDAPIGRNRNDFRKWHAGRGMRGEAREALTRFSVEKRFESEGERFTYLIVHPKTGRTHQIRVHMLYRNHPIVCDKLYAREKGCALGFGRLALHAFAIKFKTADGTEHRIEAPLPEEFAKILG